MSDSKGAAIDEILEGLVEGERSWIDSELSGTSHYTANMKAVDDDVAKAKAAILAILAQEVNKARIDEDKQWLEHSFQSVPKSDIKKRIKDLEWAG